MGFLGSLISATIKTALTPVAVLKDVGNVLTGEEPNSTKDHIKSIGDDLSEAGDDLCDGEF